MRIGRCAVVVALVVAAGLAGCARGGGVPAAGSSAGSATGGAGGSGSGGCTGDPGATRLVLTETANGSRRCLAADGALEVYLHGTATDLWSPIEVTGVGLRAVPSGKRALAIGVTAGFYAGTGPGEARLTAFRAPCAAPDPAASGCDAAHLVRITVVLR